MGYGDKESRCGRNLVHRPRNSYRLGTCETGVANTAPVYYVDAAFDVDVDADVWSTFYKTLDVFGVVPRCRPPKP